MSNPVHDLLQFFQQNTLYGRLPIYLFILLLLISTVVALFNLLRNSEQRTFQNLSLWLSRILIGGMWYQQMLWKIPPTFTDRADGTGGLRYWMEEMGRYAAFKPHASLVNELILPNFKVFALQVWAAETFIAVSLLLGLFTRLGGLLGMLMAMNLWLGLYNRPHEWPWTYFFLILLNGFFLIFRAGRALGVDALLVRQTSTRQGFLSRVISFIT